MGKLLSIVMSVAGTLLGRGEKVPPPFTVSDTSPVAPATPESLRSLEEADQLFRDAEEMLQFLSRDWNLASEYTYKSFVLMLDVLSESVEKAANKAFQETMKKISLASVEFIEEIVSEYEKSVQTQWFSFLRKEGRKELKELNVLSENLSTLKLAMQTSNSFDTLSPAIDQLCRLIRELQKNSTDLGLNAGNFAVVLRQLLTQQELIAQFRMNDPEHIHKLMNDLFLLPKHRIMEDEEETKDSFLHGPCQEIEKQIKSARMQTRQMLATRKMDIHPILKTHDSTAAIRDSSSLLIRNLSTALSGCARAVTPIVTQYKEIIRGLVQGKLQGAVQTAQTHYLNRIGDVLAAYEKQVKRQLCWRRRLGAQKLQLLRQHSVSLEAIQRISQDPRLQRGSCLQTIQKIVDLYQKQIELSQPNSNLQDCGISDGFLDSEVKASVKALQNPIDRLTRITQKVNHAHNLVRESRKPTLLGEEPPEVQGYDEEKGPNPEAKPTAPDLEVVDPRFLRLPEIHFPRSVVREDMITPLQ